MASVISAGTTTTTSLSFSGDTSGVLQLQTNGTTTAVTVDTSQVVTLSSPSNPSFILNRTASTGDAGMYFQSTGTEVASIIGIYGGSLRFATGSGDTERMRIDSSGNLLVGKIASGFTTTGIQLLSSGSGQFTTASGGPEAVATYRKTTTTTDTVLTVYSDVTSTTANKLYVQANGSVYNTTGTYGTISDIKLKENIVDATPKLADLMQVKVRNYNLIGDTEKQLGVVAQELETVFPSMVEINSNDIKTVKYSVFVPMLIKAIQELSAQVTTLQSQVAALTPKA